MRITWPCRSWPRPWPRPSRIRSRRCSSAGPPIKSAGARLVDSGADVIALGCMSLGFLDVDERLSEELGVPVINPARAALATAELLVHANLYPSKVAYPQPPKLREGTPVGDFLA